MMSVFGSQLVSDKCLRNEIFTWVDHLSENGVFKVLLKIAFLKV